MAYVITGNPGVGKHTIANALSKILGIPTIDINHIAKNSQLLESDTNEVDTTRLKKILKNSIEKSCIIVGHLAPYVLESEHISAAIVLRKNPYALIPIYNNRKYSLEKTKENLGGEILGIIAHDAISCFGAEKTFQIDTTDKSVEEIVKVIREIFNGKYVDQRIDWLEIIVKNNDLNKFFSY